jgi:hypothetical protein
MPPVVCERPDGVDRRPVEAGERSRTLANGDLLPVGAVTENGLLVRRTLDADPNAYVALTRGTAANLAYVFTLPSKRADPAPGPRPAPELARYDQIHAERADVPAPATSPAPLSETLAVLSAVLERDGQLTSATLPPGYQQELSHQAKWLWRTLHAADQALPWAVSTLGPVPGHPLDRLVWQRRAAATPGKQIPETNQLIKDLAVQRQR